VYIRHGYGLGGYSATKKYTNSANNNNGSNKQHHVEYVKPLLIIFFSGKGNIIFILIAQQNTIQNTYKLQAKKVKSPFSNLLLNFPALALCKMQTNKLA